jgi:hypothetical protein
VIFIRAGGIRITGHIHPMSSPTLAITRRIDQPVDYARESLRRSVFQKAPDLGLSRRQPRQIERSAAKKSRLIGRRRRLQIFLFKPGQDESIDRILPPCAIPNSRKRYFANWLE